MPINGRNGRNGRSKHHGGRLVASLFPKMITIMVKMIPTYFRFVRKARKAEKIFVAELVARGMDKERAKELGELYMGPTRVFRSSIGTGMKRMNGEQ